LPEPAHHAHQNERSRDQPHANQDDRARADAVDQRAGQNAKRQASKQKAQQKSLRQLSSGELKGFDEVRVEDRKAVEKNTDDKKKIQESREYDPPAVIGATCGMDGLDRDTGFYGGARVGHKLRSLTRVAPGFHPNSGPMMAPNRWGLPGKAFGPRYMRVSGLATVNPL